MGTDGVFRYQTKTGPRWGVCLKFKSEDGKWREKTWRGFLSQLEAETFRDLRREERHRAKHWPGGPHLHTVHSYFEHWLANYALPHCKRSTALSYQQTINRHLLPALGIRRLDSLTIHDLLAFVGALKKAKLAKQTIRNIITPIREGLAHAVAEGLIATNPCAILVTQLKSVRDAKKSVQPLTPKQTDAMLKAASHTDPVLYAAMLLGVRAGLRAGEVLGLRWRDVDLSAKTATIQHTIVRRKPTTPKNHQLRVVDLTVLVITAIRALPKHELDDPLIYRHGRGVSIEWLTRSFQSVLARVKLPRLRFHDLRHTYASHLIAVGASPKYIQTQLGHSSISVTMDIYGHLFQTEREVDKLEK